MARSPTNIQQIVGRWRRANGYTYQEIADAIGYENRASAWRALNSERGMSIERVKALAELTGIRIECLASSAQLRAINVARRSRG